MILFPEENGMKQCWSGSWEEDTAEKRQRSKLTPVSDAARLENQDKFSNLFHSWLLFHLLLLNSVTFLPSSSSCSLRHLFIPWFRHEWSTGKKKKALFRFVHLRSSFIFILRQDLQSRLLLLHDLLLLWMSKSRTLHFLSENSESREWLCSREYLSHRLFLRHETCLLHSFVISIRPTKPFGVTDGWSLVLLTVTKNMCRNNKTMVQRQ